MIRSEQSWQGGTVRMLEAAVQALKNQDADDRQMIGCYRSAAICEYLRPECQTCHLAGAAHLEVLEVYSLYPVKKGDKYMEQITADELGADLNTIFDRINQNHEIFSVIRDKNHAVVILDAEDYKRLVKQNHFGSPKKYPRLKENMKHFPTI